MAIAESDIQEIRNKLAGLLGQRTWGAAVGVGSFITLEFGREKDRQALPGKSHGDWHLWIYCAAWRIELGSLVLAASEDPRPKLEEAVARLNGLALQGIDFTPPILDVTLRFEQNLVLRVFCVYSEECEHWMAFTPEGNVLTAGPGNSWSFAPSSNS